MEQKNLFSHIIRWHCGGDVVQPIENESKTSVVVYMNNKLFINCDYTKCPMIYCGGDFAWRNTKFVDCQISLEGAALRTATFLRHFKLFRTDALEKPAPPPSPSTKSIN